MTGTSSRRATRRLLSVAMALVMIASVFAGSVAAAADSPSESDIADEAYVTDDGDAVLVYEEESNGSVTGEFGVDVAEGIVYVLLTDDLEEEVDAAFDLWAAPDGVAGSTAVAAERPDDLEAFSMDAEATYTDEESSFDADVELTVDASEEPTAMYLDEATTEGSIESSADHVATSGEYALEEHAPGATGEPTERIDVALSGTGGDYTLEVRDERPLTEAELPLWENETAARQTLERQFGEVATDLGGDATVTIDSYELDEGSDEAPVLDVEYAIEYEDLDNIAPFLANELADDPELDLSEAESEAFVDAVFGVEFESVGVNHVASGETIEGGWDVTVRNVSPLSESAIDLFESLDDGELEELDATDDLRAQLEAQRAAGLVQTTEWAGALASDDDGTVTMTGSLSSESENWAAYVDELEDRGIEREGDVAIDAHGETAGDEIELEVAVEIGQDDFFDTGLAALTEGLEEDPTVSESELELWRALEEADFEIAGVDVDMTDGTMTVTAGAAFDDFAAFEELIADEFHGHTVTHAFVDANGETDTGYLYVDGLVGDDPTEDDVRETAFVDETTAVYLDGSLEDHARLDLEAAEEFLDTDLGIDDGASETDGSETGGDDGDETGTDGSETDDGNENESESDDGNETEGDGNETDSDEDGDDDGDEVPGFGVTVAIGVLLSVAALRFRD